MTHRALKSGQGRVLAGGTEGMTALHGMTNIFMVLLVYTKCENVKDGWKNVIVRAAFAAPRFSLRYINMVVTKMHQESSMAAATRRAFGAIDANLYRNLVEV
jgi:hypothetical protein